MSASLLCPTSSLASHASSAASVAATDSGEDALRRLSEFLSAIALNAAAGDLESASLSLSCLGEPPAANGIAASAESVAAALPPALASPSSSPLPSSVSPYSSLADEPSPINIMVMKLRAARLAREQKRMQLAARDRAALLVVTLPDAVSATAAAAAAAAAMEDSARLDHGIPEVHQVSPKHPRNLREEAMLRLFDQSRLRRWWDWHDRQMQLLKEAKLQKQRRRQFLSNLRTHAWINNSNANNANSNSSNNVSAVTTNTLTTERREPPVDEIKRRKSRALSLSKLRIDLAPGDNTAAEDALLSPPASPVHGQTVADALTQRRDSISKLRARSPSTPTSPRSSSFSYVVVRSRSAEDHRARLVGAHSGALESQTVDYWAQWDAQEMLVEQRETLRTQMDAVLVPDSPMPTFKPRNLRRIIAQRAFLDEECAW
ncbi:hypothetical protein HDU87_008023 [Geranomyces variabilis]|uniref:Uncharacterized protein n=1 Tax=Geranomyces variabilis TaxID=109894 RepID=A0AAD5TU00_9FUNG|nr:hypothetical protein HDU87_008023 [Geranomyces variabilis]